MARILALAMRDNYTDNSSTEYKQRRAYVDMSNPDTSNFVVTKTEIGEVTGDLINGYFQQVKLTMTITGTSKNNLGKNIQRIDNFLEFARQYYGDDVTRGTTKTNNAGHSSQSARFTDSPLGYTPSLTYNPDTTQLETLFFDVHDGKLVLPKNFDDTPFGGSKIKDCVLTLNCEAGRGARMVLDQRNPNGDFEYPFDFTNSILQGYVFGGTWSIRTTGNTISGATLNAKFGTTCMYQSGATGGPHTITGPAIALISNESHTIYPSVWLWFSQTTWGSGSITFKVQQEDWNGTVWVWNDKASTTVTINSGATGLVAQKWVMFTPGGSAGVSITTNTRSYRLVLTSTATGGGFSGFCVDGMGLFYATAQNAGYSPYHGTYVKIGANQKDPEIIIYGVKGDLPTDVRFTLPEVSTQRRVVMIGGMQYRGSQNERPIRALEIDMSNTSTAGTNAIVATPSGNYWSAIQSRQYTTTGLGQWNFTIYKDRVPRNYLVLAAYSSNFAVNSETISIAAEVSTYSTLLPATYVGARYPLTADEIMVVPIGEIQFPQSNNSWEELIAWSDWPTKPQDYFSIGYTPAAGQYFGLAGLIFVPQNQQGTLDLVTPVQYAKLILTSETGSPSAGISQLNGVATSDRLIAVPIPVQSYNVNASLSGGNWFLIPNNYSEYYEASQIFTVLIYNTVTANGQYTFNSGDLGYVLIEYTPRYQHGIAPYVPGGAQGVSGQRNTLLED